MVTQTSRVCRNWTELNRARDEGLEVCCAFALQAMLNKRVLNGDMVDDCRHRTICITKGKSGRQWIIGSVFACLSIDNILGYRIANLKQQKRRLERFQR